MAKNLAVKKWKLFWHNQNEEYYGIGEKDIRLRERYEQTYAIEFNLIFSITLFLAGIVLTFLSLGEQNLKNMGIAQNQMNFLIVYVLFFFVMALIFEAVYFKYYLKTTKMIRKQSKLKP